MSVTYARVRLDNVIGALLQKLISQFPVGPPSNYYIGLDFIKQRLFILYVLGLVIRDNVLQGRLVERFVDTVPRLHVLFVVVIVRVELVVLIPNVHVPHCVACGSEFKPLVAVAPVARVQFLHRLIEFTFLK